MSKHLSIILILVIVSGIFSIGYLVGIGQPPQIIYSHEYIYRERAQTDYRSQAILLSRIVQEHEISLNRQGKEMMAMWQELGILGFKLSVYKKMTGVDVQVRSEWRE